MLPEGEVNGVNSVTVVVLACGGAIGPGTADAEPAANVAAADSAAATRAERGVMTRRLRSNLGVRWANAEAQKTWYASRATVNPRPVSASRHVMPDSALSQDNEPALTEAP